MEKQQPHVVCIPSPAQGHINPMMQFAKLLHSRGFFITFVYTDYIHRRLLEPLECLDGLQFKVISDGSPPDAEATENVQTFCESVRESCFVTFGELLRKLHNPSDGHVVTCIVSDAFMTFTLMVAGEVGIPNVIFCPMAACGFMDFLNYPELIRRGLAPLRDESYTCNGYLDTTIDWIPGMRDIRLRDLGSFLRRTDIDNFLLNFVANEAQNALEAPMVIFNTFDSLEREVLHGFRSMFPARIYSVGPLLLQCRLLSENVLKSVKLSMWKEEIECLKWLASHEAASVIYVNFGSTTITTAQQLLEFAWAIADSNHPFLWVIRPDLVIGGQTILPQEFMDRIEGRGMLVSWCPQEEVLAHPSIAVFLTHCGWNSTLESISFGVPMICWPFFSDQQTNCRYACKEWGVGMEIDSNAKREEIGVLIKEVMEGEKGRDIKKKALKWKESAEIGIKEGGSSHTNFELLIQELLQLKDI
ncbi:hypothetical protein AAC387_Pa08g0765 [Persea americana]